MRQLHRHSVTDKEIFEGILERMSEGVAPWRQSWSNPIHSVVIGAIKYPSIMWPGNVRRPRARFGVFNGFLLLSQASLKDYRTNLWVSDKVVKELNANLIAEDDRPVAIRDYDDEGNETGKRYVYNIDQVQDCERALGLTFEVTQPIAPTRRYKKSQDLLKKLKCNRNLKIEYTNYAAYSPSSDVVLMPIPEHFNVTTSDIDGNADTDGIAHYWSTLWHEVVHWTGHESRLDRERHRKWGDDRYAFEELVAELGSAFLCGYLEIKGNLQHAEYLDHWYRQLEQEKQKGRDPLSSLRDASELASQAKEFVLESTTKDSKARPESF